jgi:hypothetical protein
MKTFLGRTSELDEFRDLMIRCETLLHALDFLGSCCLRQQARNGSRHQTVYGPVTEKLDTF